MTRPPNIATIRGSLRKLDELSHRRGLKTDHARRRLGATLETLNMEDVGRPKKDPDDRKGKQTAIRVTEADVDRFERLAQAMSAETGLDVSRSAAMRAAMTSGLEVLEERYGLAKKKGAKK